MRDCVKNISDGLGNGDGTNMTWATCEYIDYKALRTGKVSAGSRQRAGSLVMIAGLVTIGTLALSSI